MHKPYMKQVSPIDLKVYGIIKTKDVYWNVSTSALYEEAVLRSEGLVAHLGPLVVQTGKHTGRSANDKFIVDEPESADHIWWGAVNRPFSASRFDEIQRRMCTYLQAKDIFVQDCWAGTDIDYRVPIRIITEYAWHSLFSRNMFVQATPEELMSHKPEFTVIDCPEFQAIPDADKTNSDVFILVNFAKKLVLIGGTSYAGEIKKSIFTIMNYLLPFRNILPMHCSANYGPLEDTALFFGLSGTGKTTLSADNSRTLIGDDEHGWSDEGVFNFEGGCYAKMIRLSEEAEPQIFETARRFGTVLENVIIDEVDRRIDFDDATLTENTRGAYPITHITNATRSGQGGHPKNIIFLTADAFGVLPPIAKLTPEQAMYHFLSGYTAKVAGTEKGVIEPEATFSACFGAPFLPLPPGQYAKLLGEKIERHQVDVWLVNTGWTGGAYGVGSRMQIAHTRAMVSAALSGYLASAPTKTDPFFGLLTPIRCPNVPDHILNPRNTWPDKTDYDDQASNLARMFRENFTQFKDQVSKAVLAAGPKG